MRESVNLTGIVLKASPVGDNDRRLVILTRERGKITAFARGAKRPGSQLMGVTRPFVFGTFKLYEGRDAYNLQGADVLNYFAEIPLDMEAACYGSYFLEFADYYGRGNLPQVFPHTGYVLPAFLYPWLLLLYQSLRALLKPALPDPLVQAVFELRSMVINGDYTEHPPRPVSDSANYAWEYIIASPLESLYTFTLAPEVLEELKHCVELNKRRFIDREFHSLEILRMMEQTVARTSGAKC